MKKYRVSILVLAKWSSIVKAENEEKAWETLDIMSLEDFVEKDAPEYVKHSDLVEEVEE